MIEAPPRYIQTSGILAAPVTFKWSSQIGLCMYASKDQNAQLYAALERCGHRAQFAIAIAITEWLFWRLSSITDVSDGFLRTSAAWAAVVDPLYIKPLTFNMHDTLEHVTSVADVGQSIFCSIVRRYVDQSIYLPDPIVKQAMLAHYVMPDKTAFADWMVTVTHSGATLYPHRGPIDQLLEICDTSNEPPVPKEFVDPDISFSPSNAPAMISGYLRQLQMQKNPYLRTAQELNAAGFRGTPYTYTRPF